MAVTVNTPVHFYFVATGEPTPTVIDDNTIYFYESSQEIYIGNALIANVNPVIIPDNILTTDIEQVLSENEKIIIKDKLNITDTYPTWET